MKTNDKLRALIDAYIELANQWNYEDEQIAEALLDIFDRKELEALGYEGLVMAYFGEDGENDDT